MSDFNADSFANKHLRIRPLKKNWWDTHLSPSQINPMAKQHPFKCSALHGVAMCCRTNLVEHDHLLPVHPRKHRYWNTELVDASKTLWRAVRLVVSPMIYRVSRLPKDDAEILLMSQMSPCHGEEKSTAKWTRRNQGMCLMDIHLKTKNSLGPFPRMNNYPFFHDMGPSNSGWEYSHFPLNHDYQTKSQV